MHIRDVLAEHSTTFSFEFFPPKSEESWEALFGRIRELEQRKPSFVSVTYGAGGSTRERTHDLVVRIMRETALDAIPHLTCLGHFTHDISGILERYAEAGVSNILALRGDAPPGIVWAPSPDGFEFAADLVRHIRRFTGHPDPRGFGVGVAGFPEGHPQTPNRLLEMDHLKAKIDEGADYICTQLFFDNRDFFDFRDRCELAGIRIPILAGIMPITSIRSARRMAELALGSRFPASLIRALTRVQDDPKAVEHVGLHWAAEQCRDLLDNQVRGIHFYTLNKSRATQRIYETLGVKDTPTYQRTNPTGLTASL
ncbi:MAG: methylenetetrahydrofolate reductase [NAD(P)H] [Phycisphaerales bacterium]|nr:methylenetetrahydrofolate reductase [NAD(P)H] [Phycisphaerales bacterium]